MRKVVMWVRRDFRFQDNAALYHAIKYAREKKAKLLFVFHLNPYYFERNTGLRHQHFTAAVLHFHERLQKLGTELAVICGEPVQAFQELSEKEKKIEAIFYNEDQSGYGKRRDDEVTKSLEENNIICCGFQDAFLHGADEIHKNDGSVYKVFTPYFKKWRSLKKTKPYSISFEELSKYAGKPEASYSKGIKLLYQYSGDSFKKWDFGEKLAREKLAGFIEDNLENYQKNRDYPYKNGTSRVSRFLKTGMLSPRTVFASIFQADARDDDKETFLKELAWRDFYHMILVHFPDTAEKEFSESYQKLEWNDNQEQFKAWCEGKTGFPIIDAAMRQLNSEGWMHNRMRMLTASFLTKDYLIDWRLGESYFAKMLVDYEPGSNIGGWQWAASVGTDAVPYFRVFNPITQSKKFDPEGTYIKKYVPELRDLNVKFIHEPWKMDKKEEEKCKIKLGIDYPKPEIDHDQQRKKAIAFFETASKG